MKMTGRIQMESEEEGVIPPNYLNIMTQPPSVALAQPQTWTKQCILNIYVSFIDNLFCFA